MYYVLKTSHHAEEKTQCYITHFCVISSTLQELSLSFYVTVLFLEYFSAQQKSQLKLLITVSMFVRTSGNYLCFSPLSSYSLLHYFYFLTSNPLYFTGSQPEPTLTC
jgi:hypothetical protein